MPQWNTPTGGNHDWVEGMYTHRQMPLFLLTIIIIIIITIRSSS